MRFLYHAGIYLLLALSDDLVAARGRGPTKCGTTFDKLTSTVNNNTLIPDTQCVYHIAPKNANQTIHLFLKKLLLDSEDSVIITEAGEDKPLFPVFHGQEIAVPLITNTKNLTITIKVSSVANIVRHFEAYYDSISTECIFKVDDDMLLTQQPLNTDNKTAECKLQYIPEANIARAFSFETFNLSSSSTVIARAVENPGTFSGTNRPPDIYSGSNKQATFDAKISSGDSFLLRQYKLNGACSNYIPVSGSNTIKTPKDMPKLNNGSLLLECRWLIESIKDLALQFTLTSINLTDPYDVLLIADGPHFNSPVLHQITSATQFQASDTVVITSGKSLTVSFKTSSIHSSFEAVIKDAGQGKYFKNNGMLLMKQDMADSIWLLQTEPDETAVLHFHESSFSSPSTVNIYDGFNRNSKQITSLNGNVWYPILSTTSKMMVVATDFKKGGFEADFSGSAVGCMYMSQGSSDLSYTLSKHCNSTCAWIIPPIYSSGTDLLLDLKFISLEDGDLIEVLELKTKTNLATVKPGTTHIPQLNIKSDSGAYVNITRGACKKPDDIMLVAQANYIPECLGKVTLGEDQQIELTSPGFPNTYPLFENCRWILTTNPPKQLIHVSFSKLSLAPNHCLILSENASIPVKYTGDNLPPDLFFTNDVIVYFNSGECDPKIKSSLVSDQGFLANVTSTTCGKVLTGSSGVFSTPANQSLCIWQISLPPPSDKESVSIIIFTVKQKDRRGNYKLDIHDGNSVRDAVIDNSTQSEMWSRTNNLTIVYRKEDPSKTATELEFNYTTKICGESDRCDNGICMHPDWRCNGENNCGDFTDEINCGAVPVGPTTTTAAPPPPPGTCGKVFTESSGVFSTPANQSLCIWQISLPPPTEKKSVSVIIFTVKRKDRRGNYKLDIHDGNSVRDAVIDNSTQSEMWSRTNNLTIVYRIEDSSKPATELEFNYTTKICGESDRCGNGICMHPDWRCNGENDCGDFTDEINCGAVPVGPTTTTTPPPPPGISSATDAIVLFMFLLGGVLVIIMLLVIIVLLMYKRVRNSQYSQFRDVSVSKKTFKT